MSEEQGAPQDGATTPAPAPATEAAPAAPAAEAPAPEAADDRPAWARAIDEAPADQLRKHPKFAGVLGSEYDNLRRTWEAEQKAKADAEAERKAQESLRQMARDNPVAFAEKYLGDAEAQDYTQQLQTLSAAQRDRMARDIGAALREDPDWQTLSADDHAKLVRSLAGVPEEQVIGVFFREAKALLAEAKANRKVEEYKATALKKEREAAEAQANAAALTANGRPDIGRVRGEGTYDDEPDYRTEPTKWLKWSDRQFNRR